MVRPLRPWVQFLCAHARLYIRRQTTPHEWACAIAGILSRSRPAQRGMWNADKQGFLDRQAEEIRAHAEGKHSQREWNT
eukprot:3910670-Pyramimonas_sp.AAC.1